jgi:hypothetical protein
MAATGHLQSSIQQDDGGPQWAEITSISLAEMGGELPFAANAKTKSLWAGSGHLLQIARVGPVNPT